MLGSAVFPSGTVQWLASAKLLLDVSATCARVLSTKYCFRKLQPHEETLDLVLKV